jgi:hypothetical protein
MKKGVMIELALQKTHGGVPNSDTGRVVRREDINAYLSAAVNYAILQQYYITKKEEGVSEIPDSFVATYELRTAYDTKREQNYVTIPVPVLGMAKNRALRTVTSLSGENFVETSFTSQSHDRYYKGSTDSVILFALDGQRVYFRNLPNIVEEVLVRVIASAGDLKDEDQVPVPAEMEVTVINLLVEFFVGTRQLPNMISNNNRDTSSH